MCGVSTARKPNLTAVIHNCFANMASALIIQPGSISMHVIGKENEKMEKTHPFPTQSSHKDALMSSQSWIRQYVQVTQTDTSICENYG
jgi:hypothetical protein